MHPSTAAARGITAGDWISLDTPHGSIRARAKFNPSLDPQVIFAQHGWWQACQELKLPGYDPYVDDGANPSTLIGTDLADPISGSLPHRSYLCRVRPAE